jgi:hypothetical protein
MLLPVSRVALRSTRGYGNKKAASNNAALFAHSK